MNLKKLGILCALGCVSPACLVMQNNVCWGTEESMEDPDGITVKMKDAGIVCLDADLRSIQCGQETAGKISALASNIGTALAKAPIEEGSGADKSKIILVDFGGFEDILKFLPKRRGTDFVDNLFEVDDGNKKNEVLTDQMKSLSIYSDIKKYVGHMIFTAPTPEVAEAVTAYLIEYLSVANSDEYKGKDWRCKKIDEGVTSDDSGKIEQSSIYVLLESNSPLLADESGGSVTLSQTNIDALSLNLKTAIENKFLSMYSGVEQKNVTLSQKVANLETNMKNQYSEYGQLKEDIDTKLQNLKVENVPSKDEYSATINNLRQEIVALKQEMSTMSAAKEPTQKKRNTIRTNVNRFKNEIIDQSREPVDNKIIEEDINFISSKNMEGSSQKVRKDENKDSGVQLTNSDLRMLEAKKKREKERIKKLEEDRVAKEKEEKQLKEQADVENEPVLKTTKHKKKKITK